MTMNCLCLTISLLVVSPVQENDRPQIVSTDGTIILADILNISGIGVQISDSKGTRSIAHESIDYVQLQQDGPAQPANLTIDLVDGSTIAATELLVSGDSIALLSATEYTTHEIRTRNIRSITLNSVPDELNEQWQMLIQSKDRTADWLIFAREESLDYVEGTAGAISRESVSFTTDGRTANAPRDRLVGIAYFHAGGRDLVNPLAVLLTVNGSRLFIKSLRRGKPELQEDPRSFFVQTICGDALQLRPNEIAKIDFGAVRYQYLSRLVPSTIEWNPIFYNQAIYEYQATLNGPRFDESYLNQPLILDFSQPGKRADPAEKIEYQHGIAMKGGTRIVFQLESQYSRLQGVCGFSPDAPQDGFVELAILGDGKNLYRQVFDNRTDVPRSLDINLRGVNRLTLQVGYHDGRNIGDILHFCDVKVTR